MVDGASWCLAVPSPEDLTTLVHTFQRTVDVSALYSSTALGVYCAWFAYLVVLERWLPGEVAEGVKLSSGERLRYRINGHLSFWVALLCMGHAFPRLECISEGVCCAVLCCAVLCCDVLWCGVVVLLDRCASGQWIGDVSPRMALR